MAKIGRRGFFTALAVTPAVLWTAATTHAQPLKLPRGIEHLRVMNIGRQSAPGRLLGDANAALVKQLEWLHERADAALVLLRRGKGHR